MGSHEPGGTSVKNMKHFEKLVRKKDFIDYSGHPYNLTALKTLDNFPMMMVTGSNDALADPKDFERLLPYLPPTTQYLDIDGYGHLDFVWSSNARELVYNDVLAFI